MRQGLVLTCALGALAALGMSGTAVGATTVSRSGNTITITGGDEINYVEQPTFGDSGPLLYKDPNGINFGPGCVDAGTGNTVQCGDLGPGLVAEVSLGGGDDTFRPEYTITTSPRLVVDLGAGNDTSWGSAGADDLRGGAGDDNIIAMGGSDTIDGGEGRDRLTGSGGDDTITGGPGVDSLFGDGEFTAFNHGNDTLNARDGEVDALSCSFGADTAIADTEDTFDVLGDCEQRDIAGAVPPVSGPSGPAPSPAPGAATGTALTVGLAAPKPLRLRAFLAGRALKFRVTFSRACTATVGLVVSKSLARRLKIGTKDTAIARAVEQVPTAGTYAATLKVKRTFRKRLRRARSVRAVLVAVCTDDSGGQASAQRTVLLRR